jgi:hypothetical protein
MGDFSGVRRGSAMVGAFLVGALLLTGGSAGAADGPRSDRAVPRVVRHSVPRVIRHSVAAAAPSLTCSPTGSGAIALAGGARIDVFDSLAQLLPSSPQPGGSVADICQARNGLESFQVQITAGAAAEQVSSASASALTGPGGATIPATDVMLSREDYTTLTTMTDEELSDVIPRDANSGQCEAADCRFPDALIPDVDPLFREKRDAFPFSVPAGQDRAIWADVLVPSGQLPGLYTGTLSVHAPAGAAAVVHISLRVIDASLPSTSTLHSAFFLVQGGGRGLTGGNVTPAQYDEYAELGLDNRINVLPDSPLGPATASALSPYLTPLLTGHDSRVLYKGAELTNFDFQTPWSQSDVAPYKTLFTQLGVSARAALYCDEGTPQDCADGVRTSGAEAAWPGIPVQVTRTFPPNGWPDVATGGVPSVIPATQNFDLATAGKTVIALIQSISGGYPGLPTAGNRMPVYSQWRSQAGSSGRSVWSYTSCDSGGCGAGYPSGEPADDPNDFNGWPSYGIDQVASEQRAMGWESYRYGITGEEYWSVDNDMQIWTTPYVGGMNGDGTLFYPWDAARVGGADPIPLESIRLKRIRDGRQDYDLLRSLASKSPADATAARDLATSGFPSMQQSAMSDASFDALRTHLMDDLAAVPVAPGGVVGRTRNASATITWKASPDTGEPPVTGYTVTATPSGRTCSTTGALTCTVTGLVNRTAYTFTVQALSSSGPSAASPASNPVVPVAVDSIDDLNCDGTADFLAVQTNSGDLLFYPRIKTGSSVDWSPTVPVVEGSGYGGSADTLRYPSMFFAGDLNGDGAPDVLGVAGNGRAFVLPGNCTGHLGAGLGAGVTLTDAIGVGDFSGDGHPDVLDRHANGTLWLLPGTGAGGFGSAQQIRTGWGAFTTLVAAGDLNGDGHPDVIARRSDGTLLLFEGNGAGGFIQSGTAGIALAPTLTPTADPVLVGAGDFDGDGHTDLAAADSAGHLLDYRGTGAGLTATGTVIGNGWNATNLDEIAR